MALTDPAEPVGTAHRPLTRLALRLLVLGVGLSGMAGCWPPPARDLASLATATPLVHLVCDPEADLVVRRSREAYRVRGNTLAELHESMEPHRFRDPSGMAWDAYTSWEVRWSYPFVREADSCSLGETLVLVDLHMQVPRWDSPADADPDLIGLWGGYIRALEAHEEGHAQLALAAACEVQQVLRSLEPQPDCERMELAADQVTQTVIDRYHDLEVRYDLETDHGVADGAMLP